MLTKEPIKELRKEINDFFEEYASYEKHGCLGLLVKVIVFIPFIVLIYVPFAILYTIIVGAIELVKIIIRQINGRK